MKQKMITRLKALSPFQKQEGLDGILVTIGLCIIALLLCVVMKTSLSSFIQTLVSSMTSKAQTILSSTASSFGLLPFFPLV